VHGDIGVVNAAAAPELLEDDVVGAPPVDHTAQVEAVELRGDAEGLVVGFEERKPQSSFGVL
jgi:hypothetical protein